MYIDQSNNNDLMKKLFHLKICGHPITTANHFKYFCKLGLSSNYFRLGHFIKKQLGLI